MCESEDTYLITIFIYYFCNEKGNKALYANNIL